MKKYLKITYLAAFCGLCIVLPAQNVQITGITSGAEGRNIRLILEDDLFSHRQIKVDEYIINDSGKFELKATVSNPTSAILAIDYYRTGMLLEAGKEYQIEFAPFNYHLDEQQNPYLTKLSLSYRITNQDSTEINRLIAQFENIYLKFTAEHFESLYKSYRYDLLNQLKDSIIQEIPYTGNSYFENYKWYRWAELEEITGISSGKTLVIKYLYDKDILYDQLSYADFFAGYYQNYFPTEVKYNYLQFVDQINNVRSLSNILDSIGKDTMLRNERFRELVFIYGLKNLYNDPLIIKSSVLALLKQITEQSKFEQHKKIAKNMIFSLTALEPGQKLPPFSFTDISKKTFVNKDLKDKYTYFVFVKSKCNDCEIELATLQKIMPKYADKVDVVVVNCDYEFATYYHQYNSKTTLYTFLHFNRDIEFLERCEIINYPSFLLVDPQGHVVSFSYPAPSQGFERQLTRDIK